MNTQLSLSFIVFINSTLLFTSRVCTCIYYTFFWPISIAALAFVTNSTTFYANQSRSGIPVLFYLFDGSLNCRPLAITHFVSVSLLIVITIADPCLLPLSYYCLRRSLLISQRGLIFNRIPIKDSTSLLNGSNFFGPRYSSNEIP